MNPNIHFQKQLRNVQIQMLLHLIAICHLFFFLLLLLLLPISGRRRMDVVRRNKKRNVLGNGVRYEEIAWRFLIIIIIINLE